MPLIDLMHHTGVGGAPDVSSPMRPLGFRDNDNRLWTSANTTYSSSRIPAQNSVLQPRAPSGFSATTMGFTSGQNQQNNGSDVTNSLGYTASHALSSQPIIPHPNALFAAPTTTAPFTGSVAPQPKNDDSRMIDSWFGGTSNAQSSNVPVPASLLTGFSGLSLPNERDGVKSTGLWGSSELAETWPENETNSKKHESAATPNVSGFGNIFSNEIPNLYQDGPQESRFNWDAKNTSG